MHSPREMLAHRVHADAVPDSIAVGLILLPVESNLGGDCPATKYFVYDKDFVLTCSCAEGLKRSVIHCGGCGRTWRDAPTRSGIDHER